MDKAAYKAKKDMILEGLTEEEKTERKKELKQIEDDYLNKLTAKKLNIPENIQCSDAGAPARRGFQILGPEGWRTSTRMNASLWSWPPVPSPSSQP